jgi:hypothetical protein
MSETPYADAIDRVVEAARDFVNWPPEGEWEKVSAAEPDWDQSTWFNNGYVERHNLLVVAVKELEALSK